MIFKKPSWPHKEIELTTGKQKITKVEQTKYLGLVLDEELQWIPHIKSLSSVLGPS
jgi:hypothetical protein